MDYSSGSASESGGSSPLPEYSESILNENRTFYTKPKYSKKRKFSKREQMLGIFADDYNSEEEDYSASTKEYDSILSSDVKFVQQKSVVSSDSNSEVDSQEDFQRVSFKNKTSKKVNFTSSTFSESTTQSLEPEMRLYNRSLESSFVQNSFRSNNNGYFGNPSSNNLSFTSQGDSPQIRSQFQTNPVDLDSKNPFKSNVSDAAWKMMQKMGYKKGKGLGKEESGIVNPIKTKSRPGKIGIAYRGFKENPNKEPTGKIGNSKGSFIVPSDEYIDDRLNSKGDTHSSSTSLPYLQSRIKKPSVNISNIQDMLMNIEAQILHISETKAPEVLSTSESNSDHIQKDSFAISDQNNLIPLKNEVMLGFELSMAKKNSIIEEISFEKRKAEMLSLEKINETQVIDSNEKYLVFIKKIAKEMELCNQTTSVISEKFENILEERQLSEKDFLLSEYTSLLKSLWSIKSNCEAFSSRPESLWLDWKLCEWTASLFAIILGIVLKKWDVKIDTINLQDTLIKPFLELILDNSPNEFEKNTDNDNTILDPHISVFPENLGSLPQSKNKKSDVEAYNFVIKKMWIPHVKLFLARDWDPFSPDPALNILETWSPPILSKDLTSTLIKEAIVPKLLTKLNMWDPKASFHKTNTFLLPHLWIHQWLLYIPDDTFHNEIVPVLCLKFGVLINSWQEFRSSSISDFSVFGDLVRSAISSWKMVFKESEYTKLTRTYIYPMLKKLVSRPLFVINARSQSSDSLVFLNEFIKWKEVISSKEWEHIFTKYFISNWLDYLRAWLSKCESTVQETESKASFSDSRVNYHVWVQISEWYMAWKSLFPKNILENQKVQLGFRRALWLIQDRMNYLAGS
ncbi:hypothetical protein BB560_004500 [Smittium megazygosporum]|uniref:G-patch domain-containing protein n=1 Tax=Smittium megazygosporum TaxID=133381 RepID=A0A2T9Z917_9FUNG|nr:hypothetical protein BB560_004500 [Smittium megazygosporum]